MWSSWFRSLIYWNFLNLLSSTIRHKINILRSLRKKCKRNPSNTNTFKLHSAEIQLESEIQLARCTYESNLVKKFARSNDSKIYKYLKCLCRTNSLPSTIHHGSVTTTTQSNEAGFFNNFFIQFLISALSTAVKIYLLLPLAPSVQLIFLTMTLSKHSLP